MILLDSDVVIAHLRGLVVADGYVEARRRDGPLHTSVVSVAEVTGGMRSTERREVWRLLDSLILEPVTERVAFRAGEYQRTYRRSHGSIGIADYLIAATATERGLELATLNVKHYPMFAKLRPAFRL